MPGRVKPEIAINYNFYKWKFSSKQIKHDSGLYKSLKSADHQWNWDNMQLIGDLDMQYLHSFSAYFSRLFFLKVIVGRADLDLFHWKVTNSAKNYNDKV